MDSTATAVSGGINKRTSGFKNKRHDITTRQRISSTQKARYDMMRQMMRQHQMTEKTNFEVDYDSPKFRQKIKEIVHELLQEQIKNAVPIRNNIPLF